MPSLRAVAKTLVVAAYLSGSAVSGPVQDQQVDLHSQDGVDGIQAFKDANRAAMISSLAHYDAKRQESNNSSPVATQTTTAVVTSGATSVPPNTPTSPPTTTITSSPTTSITTPATSTIPTTSSLSTPTSSSSPTSSPSSTPSPTSTPTSTPTSQPTSSSPPTTSRQPTSTFVSPPSSSSGMFKAPFHPHPRALIVHTLHVYRERVYGVDFSHSCLKLLAFAAAAITLYTRRSKE